MSSNPSRPMMILWFPFTCPPTCPHVSSSMPLHFLHIVAAPIPSNSRWGVPEGIFQIFHLVAVLQSNINTVVCAPFHPQNNFKILSFCVHFPRTREALLAICKTGIWYLQLAPQQSLKGHSHAHKMSHKGEPLKIKIQKCVQHWKQGN